MGLYEFILLSLTTNHINNYDQNCVKTVTALGIFLKGVIKKIKLKKINLKKNLNMLIFQKQKHTNTLNFTILFYEFSYFEIVS